MYDPRRLIFGAGVYCGRYSCANSVAIVATDRDFPKDALRLGLVRAEGAKPAGLEPGAADYRSTLIYLHVCWFLVLMPPYNVRLAQIRECCSSQTTKLLNLRILARI